MDRNAHERQSRLKRFLRDHRGSVAIISAAVLPVVLGMSGLALEYGNALRTKVESQRTADLAAYAAAAAYTRSHDQSEMEKTGESIARLNGVDGISLELVPSSDGSSSGVRARIATQKPLLLARVISVLDHVDIHVAALAGVEIGETACMVALEQSGPGLRLSGGTSVTSESCAIASNSTVDAPCGTGITTSALIYNSATPPTACSTPNAIRQADGSPARITRAETPDPFVSHPAIAAADARLAMVRNRAEPIMPAILTGPDIEFGWTQSQTQAQAQQAGCSASFSNPVWTLSCSGRSSYDFGNITIGGGLKLLFNPGGSPEIEYNFSGRIENGGGSEMEFASGSYRIAKGIKSTGAAVTRFGAGRFLIGRADIDCSGARYSICNQSTLSFNGPSTFELVAGIFNGGGAELIMGDGSANSFRIGRSSNGNALLLGGGSKTVLADSASPGQVFEIWGDVTGGGGGSCLVLGASEQHDIAGSFVADGGIIFGAGIYTVDGYLHFGRTGGGGSQCEGRETSIKAEEVSFILSGRNVPTGGNCAQAAFCVGAGYRGIQLKAQSSGPFAGFAILGPIGSNGGGTMQQGASGSQVAGAFYFPNGDFNMTGGATVGGNGQEDCFQLVARRIALSGGTTAASKCVSSDQAGAGQIRLIR